MRWIPLAVFGTLACLGVTLVAQPPVSPPIGITVSADRPGADIAPTMVGIFFEDINFGADRPYLAAEQLAIGHRDDPSPVVDERQRRWCGRLWWRMRGEGPLPRHSAP
jgi:hypothetical protein